MDFGKMRGEENALPSPCRPHYLKIEKKNLRKMKKSVDGGRECA